MDSRPNQCPEGSRLAGDTWIKLNWENSKSNLERHTTALGGSNLKASLLAVKFSSIKLFRKSRLEVELHVVRTFLSLLKENVIRKTSLNFS